MQTPPKAPPPLPQAEPDGGQELRRAHAEQALRLRARSFAPTESPAETAGNESRSEQDSGPEIRKSKFADAAARPDAEEIAAFQADSFKKQTLNQRALGRIERAAHEARLSNSPKSAEAYDNYSNGHKAIDSNPSKKDNGSVPKGPAKADPQAFLPGSAPAPAPAPDPKTAKRIQTVAKAVQDRNIKVMLEQAVGSWIIGPPLPLSTPIDGTPFAHLLLARLGPAAFFRECASNKLALLDCANPKNGDSILAAAIRFGNAKHDMQTTVETALGMGMSPEARNFDGLSALAIALLREDVPAQTLAALLRHCKDPAKTLNEPDASGRTALMIACQYRRADAVEMLLSSGADPNAQDSNGQSALFYAASPESAKILLARKADPNLADNGGNTPLLHHIAQGAHDEPIMIKTLASSGARADLPNKQNETALSLAAKQTRHPYLATLASCGADLNKALPDNSSVLHVIASAHDARLLSNLPAALAAGCDINRPNSQGQTPIAAACARQTAHEPLGEPILALLKHGANPAAADAKGRSILHLLLAPQHDKALQQALAEPACSGLLNLQDSRGRTPLMEALLTKQHHAAKILVQAGAGLDIPDLQSNTPRQILGDVLHPLHELSLQNKPIGEIAPEECNDDGALAKAGVRLPPTGERAALAAEQALFSAQSALLEIFGRPVAACEMRYLILSALQPQTAKAAFERLLAPNPNITWDQEFESPDPAMALMAARYAQKLQSRFNFEPCQNSVPKKRSLA